MNIVFCGFGNPDNRGCEAIIRTISSMTKEATDGSYVIAMSNDFGRVTMPNDIDTVDKYTRSYYPHPGDWRTYVYYGMYKLFNTAMPWCEFENRKGYRENGKIDLCISVGGDNFCYNTRTDCYSVHHRHYKKSGAKLVHWGSSFEKNLMRPALISDLNQFDAIMVRESISYENVSMAGVTSKLYLVPDPAFTMKPQIPMDAEKIPKGCIGINISPMIISKEHHKGAVEENILTLIDYIIENTDNNILFIPHVCDRNDGTGDYSVMRELYNKIKCKERCYLVDYKYNAMEYKYIISTCKMFVGARTHSTIAAYSSCVPTLTIGYSVKAKGIAKDLFGNKDNYVIPTQDLSKKTQLKEKFCWLNDNAEDIKLHLQNIMPEYIDKAHAAVDIIRGLI